MNSKPRITASKALRGYVYWFETGKDSGKFEFKSADHIASELRSEGFRQEEIESQFAAAIAAARSDSDIRDQFMLTLANELQNARRRHRRN